MTDLILIAVKKSELSLNLLFISLNILSTTIKYITRIFRIVISVLLKPAVEVIT
jgi:hypothetical protein